MQLSPPLAPTRNTLPCVCVSLSCYQSHRLKTAVVPHLNLLLGEDELDVCRAGHVRCKRTTGGGSGECRGGVDGRG